LVVALAGPNADGVFDSPNEDFAVAVVAGMSGSRDRIHNCFDHLIVCDNLKSNSFDKVFERGFFLTSTIFRCALCSIFDNDCCAKALPKQGCQNFRG